MSRSIMPHGDRTELPAVNYTRVGRGWPLQTNPRRASEDLLVALMLDTIIIGGSSATIGSYRTR
jgi:hypothetical protein